MTTQPTAQEGSTLKMDFLSSVMDYALANDRGCLKMAARRECVFCGLPRPPLRLLKKQRQSNTDQKSLGHPSRRFLKLASLPDKPPRRSELIKQFSRGGRCGATCIQWTPCLLTLGGCMTGFRCNTSFCHSTKANRPRGRDVKPWVSSGVADKWQRL